MEQVKKLFSESEKRLSEASLTGKQGEEIRQTRAETSEDIMISDHQKVRAYFVSK